MNQPCSSAVASQRSQAGRPNETNIAPARRTNTAAVAAIPTVLLTPLCSSAPPTAAAISAATMTPSSPKKMPARRPGRACVLSRRTPNTASAVPAASTSRPRTATVRADAPTTLHHSRGRPKTTSQAAART